MSIKAYPALLAFLSTTIANGDADGDLDAARAFAAQAAPDKLDTLATQAKRAAESGLPLDELGAEANRWFGDEDEAKAWLRSLAEALEPAGDDADGALIVKDSNGTVLAEGDSVTVIKDLPVKGGDDVKRGTMVRKIHLTGDPGLIEAKVNGTTLVLKTIFLKKA